MKSDNEYKIVGEPVSSDIQFHIEGGEVLRLDEKGFHYKGQTINDAGEAHALFLAFMKKAQEVG